VGGLLGGSEPIERAGVDDGGLRVFVVGTHWGEVRGGTVVVGRHEEEDEEVRNHEAGAHEGEVGVGELDEGEQGAAERVAQRGGEEEERRDGGLHRLGGGVVREFEARDGNEDLSDGDDDVLRDLVQDRDLALALRGDAEVDEAGGDESGGSDDHAEHHAAQRGGLAAALGEGGVDDAVEERHADKHDDGVQRLHLLGADVELANTTRKNAKNIKKRKK